MTRFLTQHLFFLALPLLFAGATAPADTVRNIAEYNLADGVGLKGYDPVAVFPEGGGQPKPGLNSMAVQYQGVTYYFSSQENLNIFTQNPSQYEPTYGGWCAYAMASGSKVDIQPQLYTLHGHRAHYFVSQRAKQNFDRDQMNYEANADANWKRISGEDPRF